MTELRAMTDMAKAIRETAERFGPTLRDLDNDTLNSFRDILRAFLGDLEAEYERRLRGIE